MINQSFYRTRWFKAVAGLIVTLLLIPVILRPVLVEVLLDNGFEEASIDNIGINWFTGVVTIEKLSLGRDGSPKLSLGLMRMDITWLSLLQGELAAESAEIEDVVFAVIQRPDKSWDIVAPIPAGSDEEQIDDTEAVNLPKLGLGEFKLRNAQVQVETDFASGLLKIDSLELQRLSSWQDRISDLSVKASWNGAPINIDIGAKPFQKNPAVKGRIVAKGLPLSTIGAALPADIADFTGKLDMNIDVDLERDSRDILSGQFAIDLTLAELALKYRNIDIALAQFHWGGDMSLALEAEGPLYQVAGSSELKQLAIKDYKQPIDLLQFESLVLKSLVLNEQLNVSFEQLDVNELSAVKVAQASRYWLTNKQLQLKQLHLQGQALSLASVAVDGAHYNLTLNKQGDLQDRTALQAAIKPLLPEPTTDEPGSELDSDSDPEASESALQMLLGELLVTHSVVNFEDQRFKKTYENQLYLDQFSLVNLDQSKPNQLSPLQLQARVGEFSSINFTGDLTPFTEDLSLALKGKIAALPLPQISPYAEAYLGYQFMTGQYDHTIDLAIANNELKMDNNLKLRRLELKSVDEKSAEKMAEGLDVPLPLALSMLRDRKGVIDLDVPLEGKLDEFDVGLDDIINTALVKALKHGSMSYLQLALQPYGAAVLAADLLVDQVGTIRFEPVMFVAGTTALEQDAQPYVEKLKGMLLEREGLSLSLCGRSTLADHAHLSPVKQPVSPEHLDKALMTLASDRAKTLKRDFVEAGVASDRLYLCKPDYNETAIAGVIVSM